MEELA